MREHKSLGHTALEGRNFCAYLLRGYFLGSKRFGLPCSTQHTTHNLKFVITPLHENISIMNTAFKLKWNELSFDRNWIILQLSVCEINHTDGVCREWLQRCVINDTYLKIDKNIKHRSMYKEEWDERESARKDQVQVFAERRYSEDGGLQRVYQSVKTDEMWTMTSPRAQRLTQNIKFTLNFTSLFESKELLSFIILNSNWRVWPWRMTDIPLRLQYGYSVQKYAVKTQFHLQGGGNCFNGTCRLKRYHQSYHYKNINREKYGICTINFI